MKEGGRSGDHSGAVLKKKSSSGCLIIKKKGGENGVGMGGFSGGGGSSSRQFFDSGKEKKRSRMVLSDSESSDEFVEPVRRKLVPGSDNFCNGSAVYEKRLVGSREIERDRIRNGLDVFEFDEYERFDENIRKDFYDDRLKLYRHSGDPRESGGGSSRIMVDKRKYSYIDGTSNVSSAKSKSKHGSKNRYETDDDEANLPISLLREKYREASDEAIRVQGKNGVLKVMVNKKKKMDLPHKRYDHVDVKGRKDSKSEDVLKKKSSVPQKSYDHLEAENRKGSTSEDPIKMKAVMRPSFRSEKHSEKPIASARTDKSDVKLRKSLSNKSSKQRNDNATALKLGSPTMRDCTPAKAIKSEGQRGPPTETITQVKDKESKVKRGSGTEKQLLREKIRNMLLAAGWKIDYRPRRNRDYLDAVYINTSGTAYWSIIKAYEAFQKEEKAELSVNPLPDEILSKLTRQTRKKREREMKKKRRDEGISRSAKKAKVSDQQEDKLSSYMKPNLKSLKTRLNEADDESGDDSSDNLEEGKIRQDKMAKPSSSTMVQGRKSRKIGRTLVVRSSDKGQNSENDGFVPYSGKRTLLSWLIDSGTVDMSEKVQYMNRRKTRAMLEGWITRDGIHCGCCSKILTVSKFELHAGSKLRLPFPNIFLQSGKSLMQCQIDAWNKRDESDRKGFHTVKIDGNDPNDDTCGLCGDGGDLICCDGCPSTFHQSCLNIQMLPKGDWHCPNCACKFCGIAGGSSTEASGGAETALLMCRLCQKKCHESCMDDVPVDCSDATVSFCGSKCRELYSHLLKLLGIKHELESGFSWSLLCRSDPSSDALLPLDVSQKVECNSKLAIALSVMDECFLPIVDRRSGVNLIHNVVYNCGSNFSRLNYSGFYTAILERGDEIIAAASIRIHGIKLAEMPFIGTRHIYRRQGMCRRLLSAIESALSSFKVEKLIIPAIAEHMHTWTDVFGFTPINETLKQEMRSMNMLVFPGTDMLQKPIKTHEIPKGNTAPSSVEDCLEVESNKLPTVKPGLDSSNLNEINFKISGTESSSQVTPAVLSDDSSLDTACEPVSQLSSKNCIPSNSPFKVDESKLNSSFGLDLNTFGDTEEQEGYDISDKVDDVDSNEPDAESFPKESVSVDALTDKNLAESATDLKGESPSDSSAVVLKTSEPPSKEKAQLDTRGSESNLGLQRVSVSDETAVALVIPERQVQENVELDGKGSECKPSLQSIYVNDESAVEHVTPEAQVQESVELDNKGSESKPDLLCVSVGDESTVACETPEPQVEEKVQLVSKGSESKSDLQCVSVSDASAVALASPEPQVQENELDSKGPESNPDFLCISVSGESLVARETPECQVIEKVKLDIKGSESKPDLKSISVSDESTVARETPEPQGKVMVHLDIKGSESKPGVQCISISDACAVSLETPEPSAKENVQVDIKDSESKTDAVSLVTPEPLVKENVLLNSKGSESEPVTISPVTSEPLLKENVELGSENSESKPDTVSLVTPGPLVKENVQLETKGSEAEPDAVSLVTPETLVKENVQLDSKGSESEPVTLSRVTPEPLLEENVELDSEDSESKPDTVSLVTPEPLVKENVQLESKGSESEPDAVSLVTPEPLVKENVQLARKGSESKPDVQCVSVSEAIAVSLETPEPPVKEKVQLDSKGSETSPDLQPISVSNSSPVALKTPDTLEENIQSPDEDHTNNADEANKKASLKLEDESLEQNLTEEENKNPNPESLSADQGIKESAVKLSSDLNLPGTEETERKPEVASNAEIEHKEI